RRERPGAGTAGQQVVAELHIIALELRADRVLAGEAESLVQGGDVVDPRLHAEGAEFEPSPLPFQVAFVDLRGDAEPPAHAVAIAASDSLPRVAAVDRAAGQ